MAIGDDTTENRVSPFGLNSVAFGRAGTMLSPEDVAWADSCLTKDPELSDSGWNSLRDALLETLSSQHDSTADEKDILPEIDNMEIYSSGEGKGDVPLTDKAATSTAASSNGAEPSSANGLSQKNNDDFWSRHKLEDVFRPKYNEHLTDLGTSNSEVDLDLKAFEPEQSTNDIFKIWDLGIPHEEDDLIKLMNKALADGSLEPTTSTSTSTSPEFEDASLNNVISGIADLSLSSNPN